MSEAVKKNAAWAVERLGLPTALCLLFWFGFRADARESREASVGALNKLATATQLQQVSQAELTAQARETAKQVETLAGLVRDNDRRLTERTPNTSRIAELAKVARDNERRLSVREGNAFTAQQGLSLRNSIDRNTAMLASQVTDLDELADEVRDNREAIAKLVTEREMRQRKESR